MATRKERAEALASVNEGGRGFASGLKIELNRIDEEYVPALKSWQGRVDIYQRMFNSDSKLAAGLRANILPIVAQAERWRAEGGTDEVKAHVEANLLRRGDPRFWCETSWTQRLFEGLLCQQYGITLWGKTREIVDGKMIFRRLTYLHPRSLGGPRGPWEFNAAGTRLVAVHRAYKSPDGMSVFDERIPVEDLSAVIWWMSGEMWEGVPMIRPMYRAWVEKDLAQKIQMVDLQNRGVGIPKAKLGPSDGAKEAETLGKIAKDLRGGSKERQYIVEGHDQEIKFLTSEGGVLNADPIIQAKNNEYAAGGGTDFQQQGQTQSGSRATGSVLMVSYMQELDATRVWVQEQINDGAGYLQGQVEELTAQFGPQEEATRLVGPRVNATDQLDNVPNILDAIQKGGMTHDLHVENYVRKAQGVRELTPEEFERLRREQVKNLGGRPHEVRPSDVDDARDDDLSRVGLQEKKTLPAGMPQRASGASYGWLASRAS